MKWSKPILRNLSDAHGFVAEGQLICATGSEFIGGNCNDGGSPGLSCTASGDEGSGSVCDAGSAAE